MHTTTIMQKMEVIRYKGLFSYTKIGNRYYRVITHSIPSGEIILLPIITLQDEEMRKRAKYRLLSENKNPLA